MAAPGPVPEPRLSEGRLPSWQRSRVPPGTRAMSAASRGAVDLPASPRGGKGRGPPDPSSANAQGRQAAGPRSVAVRRSSPRPRESSSQTAEPTSDPTARRPTAGAKAHESRDRRPPVGDPLDLRSDVTTR